MKGILSLVSAARKNGYRRCFLPGDNVREGRAIKGIQIVGVESLRQMAEFMGTSGRIPQEEWDDEEAGEEEAYETDYSQVQGQLLMKRATEVAVAGYHNLLYIGPAGGGRL